MEFEELIRTVRKIDISDKNIYVQKLSGLYQSKLKGDGLSFDSIRKYEIGDDVRDINWNVTARFNEPHINTFTEDKQRLIWIIIDVSGSSIFGANKRNKIDLEIEIGANLAYNAIKNGDSVGAIFFSDKVEKMIPPAKGMQNFWLIAKTMTDIKPSGKPTNLNSALEFLIKINSKRSLAFVLSDFIDNRYADYLKNLQQKHKLIAIKVFDKLEREFPNIGWIKLKDAETGKDQWVNTGSAKFRKSFNDRFETADLYFKNAFSNNRLNTLLIATDDNVEEKLLNFIIVR
jgi:uncharacterized protein (DUF58 family)